MIPTSSPGAIRNETPSAAVVDLASGVPVLLGYGDPGLDDQGRPAAISAPTVLESLADFQAIFGNASSSPNTSEPFLAAAVKGFFDCGGSRCLVVLLSDVSKWEAALESLGAIDEFDLICAPSLSSETSPGGVGIARVCEVQAKILHFCTDRKGFQNGVQTAAGEQRPPDCFAILDAAPVTDVVRDHLTALIQKVSELGPTIALRNGALYHPWIQLTEERKFVPPSGHIAGVYSITDATIGPYKAPANVALQGVVDLAQQLTDQSQEALAGVNCLRAFPGRGIRIWGARTILAATVRSLERGQDGWPWIFINVQRLFISVGRWIEENMRWAVFEPHNLSLWNRVSRQLRVYFEQLYQAGALAGRTVDEAVYVKCDAENNPVATRAAGRLIVDVGLAPAVAGELILVRFTQSAESVAGAANQ